MFTELEFVAGVDLADIAIWAFTLFFFGLVFYLQQESRREGYPLEADTTGKVEPSGVVWFPPAKTFRLPHGRGEVSVPHSKRDSRVHALRRVANYAGSPYEPTGDPLRDGVGPASYAERDDVCDLTLEGQNRIVPLRITDGFHVEEKSPDPRGKPVVAADKKIAGKIVDLWIDRSEAIFRYLEAEIPGAGEDAPARRVLIPVAFANTKKDRVVVEAIRADQFAHVPTTKSPDAVTRLEEDKIMGYYGGGKLYAFTDRQEPWI